MKFIGCFENECFWKWELLEKKYFGNKCFWKRLNWKMVFWNLRRKEKLGEQKSAREQKSSGEQRSRERKSSWEQKSGEQKSAWEQ